MASKKELGWFAIINRGPLVFNKYLGISPMYAFNGSRIFDDGNIWDGDGVTNIRSQYGFNYNEKSAQQGDAPEPASPAR